MTQFKGSRLRNGTAQITCDGVKLNPWNAGSVKFEWGMEGVHTDTSALAILLHLSTDIGWAARYFKDFSRKVVAKLDEGSWTLVLYPRDIDLIANGVYSALSRTDGTTVVVMGPQPQQPRQSMSLTEAYKVHPSAGQFGVTPVLFPTPDPALGRPRIHYYQLPRPECSNCGCPEDLSDLKLVTYAVPFKSMGGNTMWVRGAALRNPDDPASRKAGRAQAKRRALDAYADIMTCRTPVERCAKYAQINAAGRGVRVIGNLATLQNEEEMTREVEKTDYLDDSEYNTRSAKLRYYHDLFVNKHFPALSRRRDAIANQSTRVHDDLTFAKIKALVDSIEAQALASRPRFFGTVFNSPISHLGFSIDDSAPGPVANVHTRDQQATIADPGVPTDYLNDEVKS